MTQTLARPAAATQAMTIEQVLVAGDLAKLSPEQRLSYYQQLCDSLGLNPLTRPFEYLTLSNKLVLYARKDCTDQLRSVHNVSVDQTTVEEIGELFVVTARAKRGDRYDSDIGVVNVAGLRGEALANAMMKAHTKAKRRVTLSICGLGMLDESEVDSIVDRDLPGGFTPIRERDVEDGPRTKRPRTRGELVDRYALLVGEAHEKGLELDAEEWALAHDATADHIKVKGAALRKLIDAYDEQGAK